MLFLERVSKYSMVGRSPGESREGWRTLEESVVKEYWVELPMLDSMLRVRQEIFKSLKVK